MKLILDEGMPLRAAAALREIGVDARHVLEMGLGGAADESILAKAIEERAAVAMLDSDFHRMLAATRARGPSVIRARIEGLKGPALASLLHEAIGQAGEELASGAVLSVQRKRIRLRRLPLRQ